jgi:molybdenum cofactor cytidylyltransferase
MISAILLAAGQSSRMNGINKLTKEIDGIPVIKHSTKNILNSAVNELIVVLGHEKEIIENIIGFNKKIKFVHNKEFINGISSSIKIGLNHLSKKTEAFFICLGDMPMVNQSIYNKLIKTRLNYNKKLNSKNKKDIIIPEFEGLKGNPILFSILMKNKILSIHGDNGAKDIIDSNKDKILNVKVNSKSIINDFDTQQSFENL